MNDYERGKSEIIKAIEQQLDSKVTMFNKMLAEDSDRMLINTVIIEIGTLLELKKNISHKKLWKY